MTLNDGSKNRVLLCHSVDDEGTLKKIVALRKRASREKILLGHLVLAFARSYPFDDNRTLPFISDEIIDSLHLEKGYEDELLKHIHGTEMPYRSARRTFLMLDDAITNFAPNFLIVHSGLFFRWFTQQYLAALGSIRKKHVNLKIGLEANNGLYRKQSWSFPSIPENFFDVDPETRQLVKSLLEN